MKKFASAAVIKSTLLSSSIAHCIGDVAPRVPGGVKRKGIDTAAMLYRISRGNLTGRDVSECARVEACHGTSSDAAKREAKELKVQA